jgi:haloalkane dehalogenase
MLALRTPDSCFAAVPDFAHAPRHVDVPSGDGAALRMAYVDAGPTDAPVVLMLHGEPSWSFLYRKVIRAVTDAGLRAVAPDLIGFGRSDKPAARGDYTYQRHVDWVRAFLNAAKLSRVVLLCQDWGGLIGLRLVGEEPERFAGVVAANTFLPTGDIKPPEAFFRWREHSQTTPDFQIGKIISRSVARPIAPEVVAAYDAPFPDESYKAGARAFPMLVPAAPDDPASEPNRRAWKTLQQYTRPFVTAFGDSDPITRGGDLMLQAMIPGAKGRAHRTLEKAGHFLQEDVADELGAICVAVTRDAQR